VSARGRQAPARDAVVALLRRRDPIAAAQAAGVAASGEVRVVRGADPPGWLVDGEEEGDLAAHVAAHREGRPSVASVAYGAGVAEERVADRLRALADLARASSGLRAVTLVPAEGTGARPGSWGVEDLTVVAVARLCLPPEVAVRPHWRRLGPAACQVAVAFGAGEWVVPEDGRVDPERLAAAVGRSAVPA
jgi:hypothetical protein